jgi:hypothetical protein
MTNEIKAQLKTELQNAKAQGQNRAARIRDILKTAAAQTVDEVKQGSSEMRNIATGTFSTVVDTLADDKTVPPTDANPDDKRNLKPLLKRLFVAAKARLTTQFKQRAVQLDDDLGARYGDRYQASKQRIAQVAGQVAQRYQHEIATAKAQGSTPLQQTQVGMHERAGAFGSAAARTEQQIKQRLKSFLQTTVTKL